MKKHISAAFAVLALAACSKMAPENETVISELPEGENQQETVEPKGEGIVFQLPETKVILNGDTYQFEGTEEIVVKARSGAVTVMTNTTTDPNIFKGVFETSLGRKSETFDFYFNCANKTTAEQELVQNGQPWLECIGVTANRVADDSEANYIIDESKKIELRELENCITLALVSTYNCTVDFHSLSAEIPAATQDKTIAGMSVTAGKPYFVNINTDTDGEFKGGFYLAVNKTGKTGTMYTSYATAKPISKNTRIQIKTDFTPLSISGSLTGFETTYDLYKTKGAAFANEKSNDYMAGGNLKISVQGISTPLLSLVSLVSLDSITITSSDGKELGSSTRRPKWSNKEFTWDFNAESSHTTWGELTITATAVFNTPAGKVTAEVPALSRHITGLPYKAIPPTEANGWSVTRGIMGLTKNIGWQTNGVKLKAARDSSGDLKPLIQSPSFHLPNNENLNITSNLSYVLRSFKTIFKTYTTTMKFWISGTNKFTNTTQSTSDEPHSDSGINGTLISDKKYVELEAYSDGTGADYDAYAIIKGIELYYR